MKLFYIVVKDKTSHVREWGRELKKRSKVICCLCSRTFYVASDNIGEWMMISCSGCWKCTSFSLHLESRCNESFLVCGVERPYLCPVSLV